MSKKLILGSSSPYRKSLLERLQIPFTCINPNIDETPQTNESAESLVKRLAFEKAFNIANAFSNQNDDYLIIGSDQVATLDGFILGKPGNLAKAQKQLALFSGKKVQFITGLCLLDAKTKAFELTINKYYVYFRTLTEEEILYYLQQEQPFDCAGSFKCEGLGIALFEKMEGSDPNALIGLPLIDLCNALRRMGLDPLKAS